MYITKKIHDFTSDNLSFDNDDVVEPLKLFAFAKGFVYLK
jgi:hypothetical protein